MGNIIRKNLQEFSLDEIKQHTSEKNCWIIVNSYVYDVTNFLQTHPAGKEAILNKSGKNCTEDMQFHSDHAQKILKKFKIGSMQKNK